LVSGVVAEKAGDALEDYNAAVNLASGLRDLWNAAGPATAGIGLLSEADLDVLDSKVRGALAGRLAAFRAECAAVESATAALERRDLSAFAAALNASQNNKETLLGNQIPETSTLCRLAREHGALAATSFGAGFGGAVVALMPVGPEDSASSILSDYEASHGRPGAALVEEAGPGAFLVGGAPLRG
jgi:galactokinase